MKILKYIFIVLLYSCNNKVNSTSEFQKEKSNLPNKEITNDVVSDYEVIKSNNLTQTIKWNKAGILIDLPNSWSINYSTFGDTIKKVKKGELMPGLMTPKETNLSGKEFLKRFKNFEDIKFEETNFSMGGMPSTVMHTDSISLKNANWFLGISESDYEGGDYGTWYSYLYFGDFDKQKMLIQFYKYQYDLKDIDEFNKIVESIRIIN